MLERLRLVAKARPDGVEVLARCHDKQPMVAFENVSLAFSLRVRNGDFPSFTQLPALGGASQPWRASRPTWVASDGQSGELEASVGEAVVPPELLGFAEIRAVSSTWVAAPRHFTIRFAAQQARWIYYVVNPGQALAHTPKLIEDKGRLGFAAADPDPETEDPIATRLAAHYPAAQRFRLVSQLAVGCRKNPGYRLRLSLDGQDDPAELTNEPLLALPALNEVSQLKPTAQDQTTRYPPYFYKVVIL